MLNQQMNLNERIDYLNLLAAQTLLEYSCLALLESLELVGSVVPASSAGVVAAAIGFAAGLLQCLLSCHLPSRM